MFEFKSLQESNFEIIDNFLSEKDFENLQNLIMGEVFPWNYFPYKVHYKDDIRDFQFCHVVYHDNMIKSNFIEHFNPLLIKLNAGHLVRLKVNLTPRTDSVIHYESHIDVDHFNFTFGKTAVYYVNNNDGFTILESGEKIESIENRLLVLNSNTKHFGTSCTNQRVRCVVNINFFPRTQYE